MPDPVPRPTLVHLGHVPYEAHHHRALFEAYARRARFLYLETGGPEGGSRTGVILPRRSAPAPEDRRAGPEIVRLRGPLPGRRLHAVNQWNWWWAARTVLRGVRRGAPGPVVLVTQTPDLLPTFKGLPADATVYLVIDDYVGLARDPAAARRAARGHRRMAREADLALAISMPLVEELKRHRQVAHLTTTGVDFARFMAAAEEPESPVLAAVPRPRVGLIGNFNERIDWPLIGTIARRRPDWQLVLIGPLYQAGPVTAAALEALGRLPNVHLLPAVPEAAIGACAVGLDVCLIAYRVGPGTESINPLKLYQYLAAGRPVVATPLPALEGFRDVIALGGTPAEYESSIARALASGSDPSERARRQERARAFDWDGIAASRLALFQDLLGARGR